MSRIYTRTGDTGETGLFGGGRVRKDDLRVAAYGTVDELNAVLGVTRGGLGDAKLAGIEEFVERIQHQLFDFGAELATPQGAQRNTNLIEREEVAWLEETIDAWEQELTALRGFILPGGSPAAAHLHWARTVSRRAERLVVKLAASEPIRGEAICYINRLSDALFVAARMANHLIGVRDVAWKQKGKRSGI